MSIKNIRLEVMQFLKKNVDSYVDQYLIPVEKYGNLLILPNSDDNFLKR
jgi:acyl-[acyl-carrier-protein] desaturase